jgi:hypothetical protein
MRSSRIPEATELAMLKANGALLFNTEHGDLWGIFDDGHVGVQMDRAELNSSSPQIECLTSDAERCHVNSSGARISHKGETFEVRDAQPDGTGHTFLILDRI